MTGDVTILYQGGSGGFALYYYLLLTGQFQHTTKQTWQMINHQFPTKLIANPRSWKSQELWPNNTELKQQPGPRLFLICNPLWDAGDRTRPISDGTHKILLYTDLHLQLRMAWEKRAYWFTDISRQVFAAPDNDREYIRWILQSGVEFNGITVDPQIPNIIEQFVPDQLIRLQDFVHGPANADQRKFLDHWINLQPEKALRLMQL
jgi:hypothetical protein